MALLTQKFVNFIIQITNLEFSKTSCKMYYENGLVTTNKPNRHILLKKPSLKNASLLLCLFSRTTWLSQHQQGKPFWILLQQEMMGWQWHQLDHMQIISTSLKTVNHASSHHLVFTGHVPFLPPSQQRQSNEGTKCITVK